MSPRDHSTNRRHACVEKCHIYQKSLCESRDFLLSLRFSKISLIYPHTPPSPALDVRLPTALQVLQAPWPLALRFALSRRYTGTSRVPLGCGCCVEQNRRTRPTSPQTVPRLAAMTATRPHACARAGRLFVRSELLQRARRWRLREPRQRLRWHATLFAPEAWGESSSSVLLTRSAQLAQPTVRLPPAVTAMGSPSLALTGPASVTCTRVSLPATYPQSTQAWSARMAYRRSPDSAEARRRRRWDSEGGAQTRKGGELCVLFRH